MLRILFIASLTFLVFTIDTDAQSTDILGTTTSTEIRENHRVFDIYVGRYQPDSTAVAYLNNFDHKIDVKILFGTWCHDSKREIPAFMKTFELVENENIQVEFIGVSRGKTDPDGRAEAYNLQYTPTFIIFSADIEVGRIVEESTESIEQDLVQILKSGNFEDQ